MSPLIHAGVGWLIAQGSGAPPSPIDVEGASMGDEHRQWRRERLLITLAAVLPDVDGAGLIVSEELYVAWHHRLAHGVWWALLTAVVVLALTQRWRVALLAVLAFHSHVLMDLCGSGPGWPILYLWPLNDVEWLPAWQWNLASWQNGLFGFGVILAALAAALPFGRTPVELFSTRGDRAVVETLRRRFQRTS